MTRPLPYPALLCLLLFSLTAITQAAEPWSAWRGPHGVGTADVSNIPVKWSDIENVAWKTPLDEPGNSTPIVWGDRIFLTSQVNGGKGRGLMCFNRTDGKQLWATAVLHKQDEKTHKTNPFCSASPATDGKHVVAWYGSAGLYCFDLEGNELWRKDLGEFEHIWGYASSPVIYQDTVILNAGPGMKTFLAAYRLKDGTEVWRRELPDATSKTIKEFRGSWSTPVLFQEGDQDLMALSVPNRLIAFDPANGETVWSCEGLSLLAYTSPVVTKDAIVAMSGYHGPALAVRRGGEGDVTQSHRLWVTEKKNPQRIGSGVAVDGHLYILNDSGIAWCIEIASGETKWEHRLGGNAWPSTSYVDGRLYAMNQDGTTFVIQPDPAKCVVLEKNTLDELTRASHAFSDGQVFIRTYKHLWCLGKANE